MLVPAGPYLLLRQRGLSESPFLRHHHHCYHCHCCCCHSYCGQDPLTSGQVNLLLQFSTNTITNPYCLVKRLWLNFCDCVVNAHKPAMLKMPEVWSYQKFSNIRKRFKKFAHQAISRNPAKQGSAKTGV